MNNGYKKFIFNLAAAFALILGITLILAWWSDVVILFKAGSGIILAVGGLLIIYSINK